MSDRALAREAEVFTRYLAGRAPTTYVGDRYADAHRVMQGLVAANGHERWLLSVARTGPAGCRIADAWGRHAAPASPLRRKLVLLLAILEVSPPFAGVLDRPTGSPAAQWAGMVASGMVSVLALLAGVVVFLPARLAAGSRRRGA
jgi:hypothetical protein